MFRVRLEDILLEVDRLCGFTRAFRPLVGYEPRRSDAYRALLAPLIAHGTNLGLTAMGDSVETLTAADLQHASQWLVREATLKAASTRIIDYHHQRPFAAVWGNGRLSSSDGQRFVVPPGTLIGAYHPRYFGHYDKAVSIYTHLSDRLGVYSTQVISCAPRKPPMFSMAFSTTTPAWTQNGIRPTPMDLPRSCGACVMCSASISCRG